MQTVEQKLASLLLPAEGNADMANAIRAGLENPAGMTKVVYLGLQEIAEKMALAAAKGEDAVDGFDEAATEVSRLQDLAPWTLHPDHGCVLRADVEELDRAPEPASTRARSKRP